MKGDCRTQAVTAGTVKLVGTDSADIYHESAALLTDEKAYGRMACAVNPYGDGLSVCRIVDALR